MVAEVEIIWHAQVYEYESDSDWKRLRGAEMLMLGLALAGHVSLWLGDHTISRGFVRV